jgi:hypothetical protein
MALVDSGRAIGAVTQLLHDKLLAGPLGLADVTVGRPEPPQGAPGPRVNLFLYEVHFDGSLRNHPLDEGQPAPLWLVLHYLLTAFDAQGDSDTIESHELLGGTVRSLHSLNFLSLAGIPAAAVAALDDNPEALKLSFQEASSDLLSKLMQGSDEKYRCSVAFEVRPVMVVAATLPRYSLLVGVDYDQETVIGETGIRTPVLPSLGPAIADVSPLGADPGETLTMTGTDLDLPDLFVRLGAVELPITAQRPDSLRCTVDGEIADGEVISAGSHALVVGRLLGSGRRRMSNPLIAGLRPVLTAAVPQGLARTVPANPASPVFGNVDLTGVLLGSDRDDLFVALYRDGATVRMFDTFAAVPPPPPPPLVTPQTRMRVSIPAADPAEPGQYRVILRVNGQQARQSPTVDLSVP